LKEQMMALSCCRQLGIWKKADKFFLKLVLLVIPGPGGSKNYE